MEEGEKPRQAGSPPKDGFQADNIISLQKPPPAPTFDIDWFYEEEEFFTDWMDEFDM